MTKALRNPSIDSPRPQFYARWPLQDPSEHQGEEGNRALRWCSLASPWTLSILLDDGTYRYTYFANLADATYFASSYQVYSNKDNSRTHVLGYDFNTGTFTHSIRFEYLKFQNQIQNGDVGQPFSSSGLTVFNGPFAGGEEIAAAGTSLATLGSRLPDGAAAVDATAATAAVGRAAVGIATGAG